MPGRPAARKRISVKVADLQDLYHRLKGAPYANTLLDAEITLTKEFPRNAPKSLMVERYALADAFLASRQAMMISATRPRHTSSLDWYFQG